MIYFGESMLTASDNLLAIHVDIEGLQRKALHSFLGFIGG